MRDHWLFDPEALAEAFPDAPPARGPTLSKFLALLHGGHYGRVLDLLEQAGPPIAQDAVGTVFRAWALAGLGRVEEAQEQLLHAELHAARSVWVLDPMLLEARKCLAAGRRQRAAKRRSKRRPTPVRRSGADERVAAAASRIAAAPVLPPPEVLLPFTLQRGVVDAQREAEQARDPAQAFADYRLRGVAVAVDRLRRYDTLLSLGVARGVDRYEYQLRTVRRVLRDFRGRALLADEVGLGKTIEACLCLEEYLQRGLARRAL
ncbi:MAG: hypothetical protein ACC662_02075, partial [Planctomycetota bacterium]